MLGHCFECTDVMPHRVSASTLFCNLCICVHLGAMNLASGTYTNDLCYRTRAGSQDVCTTCSWCDFPAVHGARRPGGITARHFGRGQPHRHATSARQAEPEGRGSLWHCRRDPVEHRCVCLRMSVGMVSIIAHMFCVNLPYISARPSSICRQCAQPSGDRVGRHRHRVPHFSVRLICCRGR